MLKIGHIEQLRSKKGTTLEKLEVIIFDKTRASLKLTM